MSKNVVFIVNLPETKKHGRNQPYKYSVDSWTKWCNKNNHELFILTERIYDEDYMNANWHKLFVFELLEANNIDYNQVLIVDADTMIHPNAPDIFELTDNKFCAVHNYGSYDWICRSIENYKKHLFPDVDVPLFEYFNSGVIVCNRKHKEFYDKIIKFYLDNRDNIVKLQETYNVGTDQPVLNFFVQKENIDYKQLGYEWNMQDMKRFEILDDQMTFTKIGWVFHFNGIPDDLRNYMMNKVSMRFNMSFGNVSMSENCFNYIRNILPESKTILEFGSGFGTTQLGKHYKMYSVENQPEWFDVYSESTTYINCRSKMYDTTEYIAPDIDGNHKGWYHPDDLFPNLPDHYDLILIDGPGGGNWGRSGFYKHIDKFNTDVPMVFDDINRSSEFELMKAVSKYVSRDYIILEDGYTGVIL